MYKLHACVYTGTLRTACVHFVPSVLSAVYTVHVYIECNMSAAEP